MKCIKNVGAICPDNFLFLNVYNLYDNRNQKQLTKELIHMETIGEIVVTPVPAGETVICG